MSRGWSGAPRFPAPPAQALRVRRVPAGRLDRHLGALTTLARAAFAGRPWEATAQDTARTLARLVHDAGHPGFVLVLAHDGAAPLGFAYGRPGSHLAALAGHPPAADERPPFELRELAVAPHARGVGAGAALHDALTAPAGPRWLTTHPHAAPALNLYRSRGWRAVRLLAFPRGGTTRPPRLLMHRSW